MSLEAHTLLCFLSRHEHHDPGHYDHALYFAFQMIASYEWVMCSSCRYTTPLKALSNQKLGELRDRFGVGSAGLQTGDASINIEGDIVVMTTEILRNMLYRALGNAPDGEDGTAGGHDPSNGTAQGAAPEFNGSEASTNAASPVAMTKRKAEERLAGVKLVVFDECHYLGDPGRGSVWEECIINLPKDILILAMSATVRNPADLSGWIDAVHGDCDTVTTSFRPVPLRWHFCLSPGEGAAAIMPLLDPRGRALNPRLVPPSERDEVLGGGSGDEGWGRWDSLAGEGGGAAGGRRRMSTRTLDELIDGLDGEESWHRMSKWQRVPAMDAVVQELAERDMLPAIWFIFSRKDCDAAAARLSTAGAKLTTPAERDAIMAEVAALRKEQPEAVKESAVPALAAGLASHHAGCLPGWKGLIERLFQRGLVKLVFATETLAAGINMPARTTLLSALSRRRDGGIVSLTHNELLQMAGRAGRRGFDSLGHCVIVQSRWEGPEFAFDLIRKGPEPLRSQFTTSYSMALNLLWSRSMEEAREFLARSFSSYLGGAGVQRAQKEIESLEARAKTVLEEAAKRAGVVGSDIGDPLDAESVWMAYQKLQGRRREEKRAARLLRNQLAEERGFEAEAMLSELGLPRGVGLDLSGSNIDDSTFKLPALVIAKLTPEPDSIYLCLGANNVLYCIGAKNISAIDEAPVAADRVEELHDAADTIIDHAESLKGKAWEELSGSVRSAEGSALTAALAIRTIPTPNQLTPVPLSEEGMEALAAQRARVAEVKQQLEAMRADKSFAKASKKYAAAAAKAGALLDRAAALRQELEGRLDGGWREFESVVSVLEAAGAFEPVDPSGIPVRKAAQETVQQQVGEGSGSAATATGTTEAPSSPRRWFTPLGLVARDVRCSNELWMAGALTHPALQTLPPPELAAVVSALVAPDAFNRANVYVAYEPSPGVTAAVEAMEPARAELAALQLRAGLDVPMGLDLRMAGVVEAWASGAAWSQITADCGLDEGDVARLLMRTVDSLRQAAFCEHLLPSLRQSARAAARAMDRAPISDLVA